jgi:hypothetical protein
MQVHRFQSPFKHWLSGLAVEMAVFGAYLAIVAALVAVLVYLL